MKLILLLALLASCDFSTFLNNNEIDDSNVPRPLAFDNNQIYFTNHLRQVQRYDLITQHSQIILGDGGDSYYEGQGLSSGFVNIRDLSVATLTGELNLIVADQCRLRAVRLSDMATRSLAGTAVCADQEGPVVSTNLNFINSAIFINDIGYVLTETSIHTLDLSSQMIARVAGASTPGDSDGPGTVARFRAVGGMTRIGSSLYFFSNGSKLRAFDTLTGQLTTVLAAGVSQGPVSIDGVGAAASLDVNDSTKLSSDGERYIFFTERHKVRRLDLQTLEVATLVGEEKRTGDVLGETLSDSSFYAAKGVVFTSRGLVVRSFESLWLLK